MTEQEIRDNTPDGAESYRVKNGKVIFYRNYYNGFKFTFQRWGGKCWSYTRLFDKSEIKPL